MSADPCVELRGFGVTIGGTVVLADVSFTLPARGMTVLVGPTGGGKSTLLRTLAGTNAGHPSLGTWGEATVRVRPSLVGQHARFYIDTVRENLASALPERAELTRPQQAERIGARLARVGLGGLIELLDRDVHDLSLADQRRLVVARALVTGAALLFADEPTAGLEADEAAPLIDALVAVATEASVVLITHDQGLARRAGGTTILLAGGRVIAIEPTEQFFTTPTSPLAEHFVRTGGLALPSVDAAPETLADDLDEASRPTPISPAARAVVENRSRFAGPRGFFWVAPGLGGLPRPGIVDELPRDLEGLTRLGVTHLVTLEESATVPPDALQAVGITSIQFPIPDMHAPAPQPTLGLCERIWAIIDGGGVVAVHCRAGLGRTGTVLAACLIARGQSASAALTSVRAINPGCVQSDRQVVFLREFGQRSGPSITPAE